MLKNILKLFVLIFLITNSFGLLSLKADSHTPNMNFDFLPKFVHYQGQQIALHSRGGHRGGSQIPRS